MRTIRPHAHLGARKTLRVNPALMKCHAEERDRLLFAGRNKQIVLAGARVLATEFLRKRNQCVGLARHRRNANDNLVSIGLRSRNATRNIPDALRIANTGSAKFLDHQGHS